MKQTVRGGVAPDFFSVDDRDATFLHADPHASIARFQHAQGLVRDEAAGTVKMRPDALVQARNATTRSAEPQCAYMVDVEDADAVVANVRNQPAVIGPEFARVEAHRTFPGPEPHVSVRGLRNRVDLIVG